LTSPDCLLVTVLPDARGELIISLLLLAVKNSCSRPFGIGCSLG